MITAVETLRAELAAIVSDARVASDEAACSAYAVDGVVPKFVVYPPSAEEVAALLRFAGEHDLAVIACRNGTKLGTGDLPRRYDVALSLKEMNRVWHYEPADLTITVEPGIKFADFQWFVARRGLWLPLDPAGASRASIGGILATNSAGPLRLHYGAPRDMVLGMKVATVEGKIIKTGGRVVKNVAGYDLAKLLIGSYGTLGVMVEATLKLFPLPVARATFVLAVETLEVARELRRRILVSPLEPMRMLLLDATAASVARSLPSGRQDAHPWEMWVEGGGTPKVIERYARDLDALGRELGAQVTRLEAESSEILWGRAADLRSWLPEAESGVLILKAALPIGAGEEFLSSIRQATEQKKMRLAMFSEAGVGVVRVCVFEAREPEGIPAFVNRLRQTAQELGGALVVEHCPLELKSRIETWGPPGDDFDVMHKLKLAWDPKGILAPGRFLGGL